MNLLLANLHGVVAVLAVALCFHPWLAMGAARLPSARTRLSAYLAAGAQLAANGFGWWIYPAYREEVKRDLYLYSRLLGTAFEAKEHLAFASLLLAVAGALLAWAATAAREPEAARGARRCFAAAAWLGVLVALLGIATASARGFAYPG
jgi:hypothetical protein